MSEYISKNLAGVNVNEISGNPLQSDITFHGFTASPLLGTPQGISLYMDGVRMNQPFGDTVSWDLIPKNAISNMQLYSGSNPLFGLNTLGGAISIQTKDGRNNQGGAVQFTTGSWGRKLGEFEYGGVSKDNSVDYFVAGTWFNEEGWRDHSASDNKQLFTKLGWQGEKTSLKFTYAYSEGDMNGNGLVPRSMLASDYNRVYSWPDNTKNRSQFANLQWDHYFNDDLAFSGNVYYRHMNSSTLNGDVNNDVFPSVIIPGLNFGFAQTSSLPSTSARWLGQTIISNASGNSTLSVNDTTLLQRCLANVGVGQEAGEKCTGLLTGTTNSSENIGFSSQLTGTEKIWGFKNTFLLGGGFDFSKSHFKQSTQFGSLNANGSITPTGVYEVAASDIVSNDSLLDNAVNLKGKTDTASIFAADTFEVNDKFNITGSGRYNYTILTNSDQMKHYNTYIGNAYAAGLDDGYNFYNDTGTSTLPGETFTFAQLITAAQTSSPTTAMKKVDYNTPISSASLSGRHVYHRFNPSIGFTYDPIETLNLYGTYSEGSRAPTTIELGCANPEQPCKLPNSMAGDPDLKQVVAKTWSAGVRGKLNDLAWAADVYTTTNYDDIQFIGQSTSGDGYFSNVGKTKRQGFDLSFMQELGKWTLGGSYSYIDATYDSQETRTSNANGSGQLYCSKNNGTDCVITASDIATNAKIGYTSTSVGTDFAVTATQAAHLTTGTPVAGDIALNNNYTYWRQININKGDRLPLVPRNILKLNLGYKFDEKLSFSANTFTVSNANINGNENGGDSNGKIAGYTTLNLSAAYRATPEWLVFAKVSNVFDKQYETAGQLGVNGLSSSGVPTIAGSTATSSYASGISEAFVAPGAPRAAWIGVRYEFAGRKPSVSSNKD